MSMSDYQYTDGTGALWRVTLPDDFASALGLTAASNAVPYLPQEISPRYCTYANAVLGLTRACVVPTIANEGTLPDTLTVNSITYQRRSVIGEKFVSYITQEAGSPWAPLQLVGPKGDSGTGGGGAITSFYDEMTSDYSFISNGGNPEVILQRDLPAGTYATFAQAVFKDSVGLLDVAITLISGGYAYIAESDCRLSGSKSPFTLSCFGYYQLASAESVQLLCGAQGTSPALDTGGGMPGQGNVKGTHMLTVKLA